MKVDEKRDIKRKLNVINYAKQIGNIKKACRYYGNLSIMKKHILIAVSCLSPGLTHSQVPPAYIIMYSFFQGLCKRELHTIIIQSPEAL